jgi:hypothetical protein
LAVFAQPGATTIIREKIVMPKPARPPWPRDPA